MNTKPRVLIVDDEPDMVENCARILGRAGYPCLTATDRDRALALLEASAPTSCSPTSRCRGWTAWRCCAGRASWIPPSSSS